MLVNGIAKNVTLLPRYVKRTIIIIFDLVLCIFCTWVAFYLRLEQFIKINNITLLAVFFSITFAIPIFWFIGLYRTIIRYVGQSIVFLILIATFLYGLLYFSVISIYGIQGIPRSIGIIQPILLFIGILSSRLIIKHLLSSSYLYNDNSKTKKNALIYGAGDAGRQLLTSLENNIDIKVVGFLDNDKKLQSATMLGQNIYSPSRIDILYKSKNIDLVLLALPSIGRNKRNQIIDELNKYPIAIKTLPNINDLVEGKISFSDIKDLAIEDLLYRDEIKPNTDLLYKNIESKVVLVTGAGGSIGSELCRQIIKLNPKRLLLYELNEFSLYKINEELRNFNQNIKIIPLLGNIQNSSRVEDVFKTFNIDTVYHAAAYKHVPLVEENICESIKNNVFGTFLLAKMAMKYDVSNFVFISSDKAVRATNIMGASKRLAEVCVQSLYDESHKKHQKFSIVRFGNVLQSSGSVIPKFKKQIKNGGPVTLTHHEVTRYFMTINEATQLVIQAGAMSESCEVFVLDMGQSVKIIDLVYKMIKLSGLTVKDTNNLDGDIEIKTIGLRPGEKLYEELLLGDNPQKTYHEKIQKAQDPFISFNQLIIDLNNLTNLLDDNRVAEVKEMLGKLIPSYKSNTKIVDHIYEEQLKIKNDLKSISPNHNQEDKVINIKTK